MAAIQDQTYVKLCAQLASRLSISLASARRRVDHNLLDPRIVAGVIRGIVVDERDVPQRRAAAERGRERLCAIHLESIAVERQYLELAASRDGVGKHAHSARNVLALPVLVHAAERVG